MPLLLYMPTDRAGNARLTRRVRIWLAAQGEQCRRAQRFLTDRRHLMELDARLLSDVGLTREDVTRGVPFLHQTRDVRAAAEQ